MSHIPSPIESENADFGVAEIRANLQKLERRDLWVWGNAVVVILALAAAVFSLSANVVGKKTFLGLDYSFALRVLVTLVLVFTAQMVIQHLSFRKLQAELAEQQIQAEVFRRLAMFDPLTGLYNRRFAEQRLKAEISRSQRRGHPLIVVLADLNDFKQINDAYGHQGVANMGGGGFDPSSMDLGDILSQVFGFGDDFYLLPFHILFHHPPTKRKNEPTSLLIPPYFLNVKTNDHYLLTFYLGFLHLEVAFCYLIHFRDFFCFHTYQHDK